jgi:hypothetical protein
MDWCSVRLPYGVTTIKTEAFTLIIDRRKGSVRLRTEGNAAIDIEQGTAEEPAEATKPLPAVERSRRRRKARAR